MVIILANVILVVVLIMVIILVNAILVIVLIMDELVVVLVLVIILVNAISSHCSDYGLISRCSGSSYNSSQCNSSH